MGPAFLEDGDAKNASFEEKAQLPIQGFLK